MSEKQRQQLESGDLVSSQEELVEAFKDQPKGFNLQINVWWEDRQNIWLKVEKATGQKIAVNIVKMYSYEGKPACLIKLTVA